MNLPAAARHGVCRAIVLALALLVLAAWGAPVPAAGRGTAGEPPRRIQPADPDATPAETEPVQVRLDRVEPAIAEPDTPVTVSGSLHNLGGATLDELTVTVQVVYRGLDTRGTVARWAEGTDDVLPGQVVASTQVSGRLEPGRAVPFQVLIDAGEVAPPFGYATLPMTVGVTGVPVPGGTPAPLGSLRTFLLWDDGPDVRHNPMDLAWAVPLTLEPDPGLFSPQEEERAEAWTAALGPGSRLQELLDGLARAPVTWVVDPTLLSPPEPSYVLPDAEPEGTEPPDTEAPETRPPATSPPGTEPSPTDSPTPSSTSAAPTGGTPTGTTQTSPAPTSPTASPTDDPEPGDAVDPLAALTAAFLGRLVDASDGSPLWMLPTTDPDLTALLDTEPERISDLVARDVETAPERRRTDIAWPVGRRLDGDRLALLREAWAAAGSTRTTVVVPAQALQDGDFLTTSAVRPGPGGTTLLAYDERLSGLVGAAGDRGSGGAAVQRLLAETLAIYQEQPATDRSLLIAPPRGLDLDPEVTSDLVQALRDAPWIRQTTAEHLLRRGPEPGAPQVGVGGGPELGSAPGDPTAYPEPEPSPLSPDRLRRIELSGERLAGIAAILTGDGAFLEQWEPVRRQLYSTRWRGAAQAWDRVYTSVERAVSRVVQGLHVNPTTVNFFADEGVLQATVVNDLGVEVRDVRLQMVPGNGRLRIVEQPDPITIGPNSRTTVRFRVEALAAGQVPVEARLSTPNGTPLSEPQDLMVRVQPTSTWIYWVLGIVAGLILVLGLYRTVRPRRTRATRDRAAGSGPPTPEETPSR